MSKAERSDHEVDLTLLYSKMNAESEGKKAVNDLLLLLVGYDAQLSFKNDELQITFLHQQQHSFYTEDQKKKSITSPQDLDWGAFFIVRRLLENIVAHSSLQSENNLSGLLNIISPSSEPNYLTTVLSTQSLRFSGDNTAKLTTEFRQAPTIDLDLAEHQDFVRIKINDPQLSERFIFKHLQQRWEEVKDTEKAGYADHLKVFSTVEEEAISFVTKAYRKYLDLKNAQTKAIQAKLGSVEPSGSRKVRRLNELAYTELLGGAEFERVFVPLPLTDRRGFQSIDGLERRSIEKLVELAKQPSQDLDFHITRLYELQNALMYPDLEPLNMDLLPPGSDNQTLLYGYEGQKAGQSWNELTPVEFRMEEHPAQKPGIRINLQVMKGEYLLARYPGMKPVSFYHDDASVAERIKLVAAGEGNNYALHVTDTIPDRLIIYYEKADDTFARRTDDLDTFGFDLATDGRQIENTLFASTQQKQFFEKLKNNKSLSESQKLATLLFFWSKWFVYTKDRTATSQASQMLRQASHHSIKEGQGVCYEAAVGLVLLLRMIGFRARQVRACAGDFNGFFPSLGGHVVVDVFIDNKWVTIEPQKFENAVLSHDVRFEDVPWKEKVQINGLTRGRSELRGKVASFREDLGNSRQDIVSILELLEETAKNVAASPELLEKYGEEELIKRVSTIQNVARRLHKVNEKRQNMSLTQQQRAKSAQLLLDTVEGQLLGEVNKTLQYGELDEQTRAKLRELLSKQLSQGEALGFAKQKAKRPKWVSAFLGKFTKKKEMNSPSELKIGVAGIDDETILREMVSNAVSTFNQSDETASSPELFEPIFEPEEDIETSATKPLTKKTRLAVWLLRVAGRFLDQETHQQELDKLTKMIEEGIPLP
jgi:hypothetical protein